MARRGVSVFGNRRARRDTIRGMAFFSLNNSALDAKQYSLTGQEIDKPSYARARFGVAAGGQLRIPKIVDSQRTFFFLNYQGSRSRNPYSTIATMPDAIERLGDFSQSVARGAVSIFDPLSGLPFPGNTIPDSRINSAAVGLLSYIPLPNLQGNVRNYQFVTSVPTNTDNFGLRLNHSLSARDRLNGNVQLQQRYSESAQLAGYRDTTGGRGLSVDLGWSHTLGSRFINDLRFDFSRNRSQTTPYFAGGPDVATQLGILGTSPDSSNNGPPNLSFTNFGPLTDASPLLSRNQAAGFTEGITLLHGKHTIKTGLIFRRNQLNLLTDDNGRGSFTFSGLLTSQFDAEGNPVSGTGFDFADYLLGLPQSSSVRYGNSSMYFRASTYNLYGQDDWKIRSNLTFNVGLRYEYTQPFIEKYGRMSNLLLTPGFTSATVVTPDAGLLPSGLIRADRNNLAPRIGIAWKPRDRSRFLVRAGYGVYFNGSVYSQMASRLGQQPPFAFSNTFTTVLNNPLTIETGLLGLADVGITNTCAVAPDYQVGYAQTWNTSIQVELPHSLVADVTYLGTKGTRLDIQRSPNQAPPGSPIDSENRRPIPDAVAFLYESADGNSILHMGQVRLSRRFRRGISFNAFYTFSKSIDNVSSYGGGQGVVAQNPFDLAAERGLSSFDQRHVFNASFLLTSPVGEGPGMLGLHGWRAALAKDWTLSGGISANSGTPLTALVLGNRANSGGTGVVGSGRADASGQAVHSESSFFNPGAFLEPRADAYGNAGRNTIPGPGMFSLNLGLGRNFPMFGERRSMEFRVEANNALNIVNISRFGTTVNSSNYGLATAAGAMRSVTANVRFRF